MSDFDVLLITEDRYESPQHIDGYIANILQDDAILTAAFEEVGLRTKRVSWSNPEIDWSASRCGLFRTTWDYFLRFNQFKNWMEQTAQRIIFINPINVIRWNMDKHYLADLKATGIRVVDTTFIEQNTSCDLVALLQASGADSGIVKPAVSGTARHTYVVDNSSLESVQPIVNDLLKSEALLFQPFQKDILLNGELSLIIIDGKCTHAVRKTAKQGDFRVQDDFGGTVHDHIPTPEEIQFAESAVAACPEKPLYARVDIVRNNAGDLAIMELELIEPELWFRKNPAAAKPLAAAIKNIYFS